MHGVCVQIGLARTAEYIFLVEKNWKEVAQQRRVDDPCNSIPEYFIDKYTDWKYYGIDADPGSIEYLSLIYKYLNTDDVTWIQAFIRDVESEKIARVKSLISLSDKRYLYVPTISLSDVFAFFKIDALDILAIDVEGAEKGIFETYDWEIKPAFISVEVHPDSLREPSTTLKKNIASMTDVLEKNGYTLHFECPSNIRDGETFTHELHFLR